MSRILKAGKRKKVVQTKDEHLCFVFRLFFRILRLFHNYIIRYIYGNIIFYVVVSQNKDGQHVDTSVHFHKMDLGAQWCGGLHCRLTAKGFGV